MEEVQYTMYLASTVKYGGNEAVVVGARSSSLDGGAAGPCGKCFRTIPPRYPPKEMEDGAFGWRELQ